jgi:hypothetical protein
MTRAAAQSALELATISRDASAISAAYSRSYADRKFRSRTSIFIGVCNLPGSTLPGPLPPLQPQGYDAAPDLAR